jgi:hypothetical protein
MLGGEFEVKAREQIDNFDTGFFTHENIKLSQKDRKITKEIKRMLKFAVKRGEVNNFN